MGVMACARLGCDNILCDWYSQEHGYICNECYTELCETAKDIAAFMESEKMVDAYALEDHMRRVERTFKRCGEY